MSLVVVTTDGYAKRVPLRDIPSRRAGAKGVLISSVAIAAALIVDDLEGDVVIATRHGKIKVVPLAAVPVRRRRVQSGGRIARGAAVIALADGDQVASVVLAPPSSSCAVAQCPSAGLREADLPFRTPWLREGERIASCVIFDAGEREGTRVPSSTWAAHPRFPMTSDELAAHDGLAVPR